MPGESAGPFIQVAAICAAALQEVSGHPSIIRIIDRLPLGGPTDEMQPQPLNNLTLAVLIKSGGQTGTFQLTIQVETPRGTQQTIGEAQLLLEGAERGVMTAVPLAYIAEEPGLYWFNVLVGPTMLTSIPLRIMYQKMQQVGGIPGN